MEQQREQKQEHQEQEQKTVKKMLEINLHLFPLNRLFSIYSHCCDKKLLAKRMKEMSLPFMSIIHETNDLAQHIKNIESCDVFVQLCCSGCQNTFVEGGCCSQCSAEIVFPIVCYIIPCGDEDEQYMKIDKIIVGVDYDGPMPYDYLNLTKWLDELVKIIEG